MTKKQRFKAATKIPLIGDERNFYSLSGLSLFNGYNRISESSLTGQGVSDIMKV